MFSSKMYLNLVFVLFFGSVVLQQTISSKDFGIAIKNSDIYLEKVIKDLMIPGLVAGVSINGSQVWIKAVGYTDIENDVVTRVDSVFRVSAISVSLTSALIGRLIDEERIDLDQPIYNYLKPDVFPIKKWNNKTVNITLGQVMSNTGGLYQDKLEDIYRSLEYMYNNVTESVEPYKNEPLEFEPGTNWNYTDYGLQLVGAVIESVLNQTYESAINKLFKDLQMNTTFCERREQIIPHRARYYTKTTGADNKTRFTNSELFDDLVALEAQWPSAGIISTIPDLLKFGHFMNNWANGLKTGKTFNLSNKTVNRLFTVPFDSSKIQPTNPFYTQNYAHGWFEGTLNKPIVCPRCKVSPIKKFIFTTGALSGVAAMLAIEPVNDIVITYAMNYHEEDHFYDIFDELFRNFAG